MEKFNIDDKIYYIDDEALDKIIHEGIIKDIIKKENNTYFKIVDINGGSYKLLKQNEIFYTKKSAIKFVSNTFKFSIKKSKQIIKEEKYKINELKELLNNFLTYEGK